MGMKVVKIRGEIKATIRLKYRFLGTLPHNCGLNYLQLLRVSASPAYKSTVTNEQYYIYLFAYINK